MRKIILLHLLICLTFLFNGCGSTGGGSAYFDGVIIEAICDTTTLDSDVLLWKFLDPNESKFCAQIIKSDSVIVNVHARLIDTSDIQKPSVVRIENVRIDYIPADDNTPELASRTLALGQFVDIDENDKVPVSVMIVGTDQKDINPLKSLRCPKNRNDPNFICEETYTYYVKLTFSGVEIQTNNQEEFSTNLTLRVHDFLSNEEDGGCLSEFQHH